MDTPCKSNYNLYALKNTFLKSDKTKHLDSLCTNTDWCCNVCPFVREAEGSALSRDNTNIDDVPKKFPRIQWNKAFFKFPNDNNIVPVALFRYCGKKGGSDRTSGDFCLLHRFTTLCGDDTIGIGIWLTRRGFFHLGFGDPLPQIIPCLHDTR